MGNGCPRCKILEAEIEQLKGSLGKFLMINPATGKQKGYVGFAADVK